MIKFKDLLNEELIGQYGPDTYNINIYKNPKSINKFDIDIRGIIDRYGNLYVEEEAALIHSDIFEWLRSHGFFGMSSIFADSVDKVNIVCVQRCGPTDTFYLGETYLREELEEKDFILKIKKILAKATRINPKYDFVPTRL